MTTATGNRAHHDPTWWKAPLAATLPGLPLLVGEFAFFAAEGYTSGFETMIALAAVLLALAWVPPYRRSLRTLRTTLAVTSLVVLAAPWALVLMMGLAMSSG
ncbi:hypothetical protein ACFQ8C_22930 [Streptomyces sp. NPDC056503]|uniref:hypothetical protein n=1 Tax=Streptomyces sp. NPDC056503 TaxID=3345842 RepID=UPI00369E4BB2